MSAPVAPADAEGLPFTPGVVAASPYGDPTALLKACEVGCAIVVGCAQVLEAAGEEIPWVEAPESGKAKSMLAKGGKSKGRGASRARPRRLPGHHFATLSAICQAERERQGEACDALDDDLEESLGLQAGSFPGGRQKGSRYPPAREGFRTSRPSLHGVIARPTAPSASSLKALPAKGVQDFLMAIQENRPEQAQEAFRQVRLAVGNRARSKEAFGGLRAMLHYYLETSANSDNLDQAKSFLDELKASSDARLVSPAAFNAMLRGLLARNNFREAQRLRNEMPRFGLTPNEASLNLLMDTAARSGSQYLDEAWDILEEMQRLNLKADKYTVSILTKHLSDRISDKKRVPRGVAMVEYFLRTQPEDVDEVLVNSLLDVFCKLGDMPRLEATLEKMREYGIKGSAVTYGTIVKAYGRAGNIDRVLQAWEEMQAEGLEANAVTYGCMLDACVKCGHLEKALQIFAIMRQRGLHRNTILYATLIKGFAKSKDPLAAKNLYREMRAERVPCNVVVFNSLIDACVRACDLQGAAEVLQEMTATNVRPDLITFSTLIKGYCSNGELSKAMRLQEELQARQLECDEIVYNSLLEGCVKAGNLQLGLSMFQEMKNKRVRPSPVTFSILVKLLSRAGRLDLAVHLVSKEMRQMYDVPPTRMVWSCLVTCCLKARDLTRAVMALELLDSDCAALGTGRISMYAAVIEGSITSGEVSTALQLVDWAYSRAPPEDARVGLSMDLLKRVFETAGLRGAEAEAQETLDTVGPRIGEHVRGALEDVLMRSKGRLNLDDMGYKGSAKIVSHDQGRAWHWDQSYSSMPRYEEAPLGFGCEAWDGGYWPGADAYSVFPWNQEVAPFQWQSWDGWRAPELNLGPGHPATPMRKDCEYTPATTAGKSSHRSPLEETEDDRLRTPVQKVLFEDCIPELDGPPPGL